MGSSSLTGSLIGGPPNSGGSSFPEAQFIAQLGLTPSPKVWSAASGVLQRQVSQAAPGFLALSGVGPTDTVQRGDTLYFRSNGPVVLRLSYVDPTNPLGPPLQAVVPVQGLLLQEFSTPSPLVGLEVQGSAQIEYLITGQ